MFKIGKKIERNQVNCYRVFNNYVKSQSECKNSGDTWLTKVVGGGRITVRLQYLKEAKVDNLWC